MKVTYDIAWRVWYIEAFGQWVVHPPDGFYVRGEFTFLTNVCPLYYKKQSVSWELARKNARKDRTLAILYCRNGTRSVTCDYRIDKNEKVQATKCPKHLYP